MTTPTDPSRTIDEEVAEVLAQYETGEFYSVERMAALIRRMAEERKEMQVEIDRNTKPKCCLCGKPMKFNVPRLGPAGGFVHAHSGQFMCDLAQPQQQEKP